MINKLLKLSYVIVAVGLVFAQYASATPTDDDLTPLSRSEYFVPAPLVPQLSSDGKTLYNGVPPVVYVADPNPSLEPLRIRAPFNLLTLPPESATATFSITYVDSGTDPWSKTCTTFPDGAKTAFNAAADIWANILQSSVPMTISACWASLTGSTLGYSGGGPLHSDYGHFPVANTWYVGALANALEGYDLDPGSFDMHITLNLNYSWYYGTDGNPGSQLDLMSVVMHEIAHGLGFSGSMSYSGGTGSWGYYGLPTIYDTFMRDVSGNQLISFYTNPSTALGSALTSNNIYFHGTNAMAANVGQRVKIYAPTTWASGSSYSHLDYNTFNDTDNELMVFAFSPGESVHDPGPVTEGILEDLGWSISTASCTYSIDPEDSSLFSTSGGTGSFDITTQPGCTWTATESLDWVAITSGTGGTGSGTVTYTVSSNGGAERSGTITISGQAFTGTHTITQAGCTYSINPEDSSLFGTSGGAGSFDITTQPGCTWTATESLDWVVITSGTGGSGSGTVNYTVSSNAETERCGTITISGQSFTGTHTITQAGCTYENIYVKWDGSCAGNSPCYSSVQDAVDGADTCTIINATEDTYDEDVVLDDSKCLVLQGGWDSTLTTIQSNTTIRSLNITDGKLTVGNFILN